MKDPAITKSGHTSRLKHPLWWYGVSILVTLVSVAIMARLVYGNLNTLLEVRDQLTIWPLAGTLPVFFLGLLMGAFAWGKMMNTIAAALPMPQHFKIYIVTHAGRRIPGGLWYVVGRIAWYERLGIGKLLTSFGSVLEAVLTIWSGLIMAFAFLIFLPGATHNQLPLLVLGILLSMVLMHPSTLKFILKRLGRGDQIRSLSYRSILTWLLLYLPIWLVGGTILFLAIQAIYPVPLDLWPLCIGAWSLGGVSGMLVLVLPSGFGLSEATLSLVLATQIPAPIAVAAAILMRILLTFYEFGMAGIIFSLYKIPARSESSG